MLYYDFCGYKGFKARFGLEKRENGTVIRKNRILLAHLKSPALLKYCKEHNDYTLLHVYNMADQSARQSFTICEIGAAITSCLIPISSIGLSVLKAALSRSDF